MRLLGHRILRQVTARSNMVEGLIWIGVKRWLSGGMKDGLDAS